jgi:hypothetical protein
MSHFERGLKSESEDGDGFTMPMYRILDRKVIHDYHLNVVALINGYQGPRELFINEESLPPESIFCQPSSTQRGIPGAAHPAVSVRLNVWRAAETEPAPSQQAARSSEGASIADAGPPLRAGAL